MLLQYKMGRVVIMQREHMYNLGSIGADVRPGQIYGSFSTIPGGLDSLLSPLLRFIIRAMSVRLGMYASWVVYNINSVIVTSDRVK